MKKTLCGSKQKPINSKAELLLTQMLHAGQRYKTLFYAQFTVFHSGNFKTKCAFYWRDQLKL